MKTSLHMLSKFMDIRSRYHASKRLYPKANFVLVSEHEDSGDGERSRRRRKMCLRKILTTNIPDRTTKEKVSE